ncbi:hypothetical protein X773_26535 [Mesorhizobium sp. LSJC285A00]|nr:hypothetical protein X773_26535 [Mesorhizobium sp. LSJC285A00]
MGNDAIADGEIRNALPQRDDLAGAVGDGNERKAGHAIIAAGHRHIDEIQARGALADQHFAALRFRRGNGGGAKGVQLGGGQFDGFHGSRIPV